jgi:hypothetical protein
LKAGIAAHNGHKPEPCYNENWNAANKTGSLRARHLVMAALGFKHGICSGSMKHRKATKEIVTDYIMYSSNAEIKAWAVVYQAVAA